MFSKPCHHLLNVYEALLHMLKVHHALFFKYAHSLFVGSQRVLWRRCTTIVLLNVDVPGLILPFLPSSICKNRSLSCIMQVNKQSFLSQYNYFMTWNNNPCYNNSIIIIVCKNHDLLAFCAFVNANISFVFPSWSFLKSLVSLCFFVFVTITMSCLLSPFHISQHSTTSSSSYVTSPPINVAIYFTFPSRLVLTKPLETFFFCLKIVNNVARRKYS